MTESKHMEHLAFGIAFFLGVTVGVLLAGMIMKPVD